MDLAIEVISRELNRVLYDAEKTVSTAESCTGGGIAAALTSVVGSSAYFMGGLVAYSPDVKEQYLGVDEKTITECGVVSEEVVKQMVQGACCMFSTDYAVATSGVAGPTGGTDETPVGTIWIAAGDKERAITLCLTEDKGRTRNVENAKLEALRLLLAFIEEDKKENL